MIFKVPLPTQTVLFGLEETLKILCFLMVFPLHSLGWRAGCFQQGGEGNALLHVPLAEKVTPISQHIMVRSKQESMSRGGNVTCCCMSGAVHHDLPCKV